MKPTASDRRSRGFTLLEALIAGAIFFVALVGTTLLAVSAQTNAARSSSLTQGSRIATQEMEKWAMLGYSGIGNTFFDGGTALNPQSYPVNELVDGGGRSYQVNVTLHQQPRPGRHVLRRQWNSRPRPRCQQRRPVLFRPGQRQLDSTQRDAFPQHFPRHLCQPTQLLGRPRLYAD